MRTPPPDPSEAPPRGGRPLLALALAALGPAFAPGGPEERSFAAAVAAFDARASEVELESEARTLAGLPGALDAYFELLAGSSDGPAVPPDVPQARLLARVAERFAPAGVDAHVRAALEASPPVLWRREALHLLGLHARGADLPLLARVATAADGAPFPELREPFRAAASAVLARRPVSSRELSWLVDDVRPLAEEIVHAVGTAGDPEALSWLVTRLDDPELGPAALQEIGRLAARAPETLAEDVARHLRPQLLTFEPGRRKQALRALRALGCGSSIPWLVVALERAADDGERRMAHAALREIGGVNLPARADAWRGWYEGEQRWLEDESIAVLARLDSDDAAKVVAAIHSLSEHALHRRRIASALIPLAAEHASPAVRSQACSALARLRAPEAASVLELALEDEDEDVRRSAAAALRSLGSA